MLQTTQITLTIGPLAVAVRTPMTMAMGVASVASLTGRTTRLALGTSSTVVVERWHGRPRQRSVTALGEAARAVRALLDGEKAEVAGEVVGSRGLPPAAAGARSPRDHGRVRRRRAGRRGAPRRPGGAEHGEPRPWSVASASSSTARTDALGRARLPIAVWLATAVDPLDETIAQGLRGKVAYLAAPGYGEMFIAEGFADVVALARSGAAAARQSWPPWPPNCSRPPAWWATRTTVRARLAAYHQAGADEVCLVPATAGDPGRGR